MIAPPCRSLMRGTPWAVLAAVAFGLATVAALSAVGAVEPGVLSVATIGAAHGGLLATALAWAGAGRSTTLIAIVVLTLAAAAAHLHRYGGIAYLAVPTGMFWLTRAGRLRQLGLGTPCPAAAIGIGVLAGTFLGGHVLVSAELTFGYRTRLEAGALIPWVLYDIGAHVPATCAFFVGGLFNRAQRAAPLATAAAVATAATVCRYLVDPLLPHAVELFVGVVFYISLLSVMACWLYWRFGSLMPALAMWLVFFVAYRTLR